MDNPKTIVQTEERRENGEEESVKVLEELWHWIKAILLAVLIALVVRGFLFEPVLVDGPSMEDTLHTGEKLILYKLGSFFNPPQRGDIIVVEIDQGNFVFLPFLNNSSFARKILPTFQREIDYIKRVIALPGDEIDIIDGFVYVNGEMLEEAYVKQPGTTVIRTDAIAYPYIVAEDELIVFGDNRIKSKDSREIGPVPINDVKGKAVFRIWPLDQWGPLE